MPMTADDVRKHIGPAKQLTWVPYDKLVVSCIDGREHHGVIASPGGSVGELVLLLSAVERVTGQALSRSMIEREVESQVGILGPLYFHTDAHAAKAAKQAIAPGATPEAQIERMLEPAHIGCGHVRLMVEHAEEYGTRRELVVSVLRTVLRLLRDAPTSVKHVQLPGGHNEEAILRINTPHAIDHAPLIAPSRLGRQVFVLHREAVRARRQARAEHVRAADTGALVAAMRELAQVQLAATARVLASDLPTFDVVFAADRSYDVHE